jgi:aldose 1-epimerase
VTGLLRIAAGDSICTIAPDIGGSIVGWNVQGQPMLRTASADALAACNPLGCASFPLVPYSNRIAQGHFMWGEEAVTLPAHPIALPHAIHGVGWERAWTVTDQRPDELELTLDYPGGQPWPWRFIAIQKVRVTPDSLSLSLSATNFADAPVPLAFGHHPYVDAAGAGLAFAAKHFYPSGPDGLPTAPVAPDAATDFRHSRPVAGCSIDNLYGQWDGAAEIIWPDRSHRLCITSTLPYAVLYTPPGESYFCFEPVPHLSNALNRADGDMPVIAPGDSFHAEIVFSAIAG